MKFELKTYMADGHNGRFPQTGLAEESGIFALVNGRDGLFITHIPTGFAFPKLSENLGELVTLITEFLKQSSIETTDPATAQEVMKPVLVNLGYIKMGRGK